MRKIYLFMLMAVGLLVSGNLRAQNVAKIVETETEYTTFAAAVSAVKANQTIQLLDDASYTPTTQGYNFWRITYNLTILVGTHTLTLNVGSDQSYGVWIYNNANVTIEGELDANTNKYGTVEFTQDTHVAAFLLEDISLLTLKNVHIKTNHTWVVNVSNYSGCSSLFLGENVTFEGTSKYDVLLNNYSQSSNITIEGIHDGLKFDIASQTNGANIINNGTLTNLILHDNAGSVPTYSGTGTYELAKGSRVHKNTMSQIESKVTIATGCLSVLNGNFYDVIEPSFSVNEVGYADLNAAMAQSTEANPVLLLEDVEYGTYLVDHSGWLDLNGHTIYVTGKKGLELIGNQNYVFMDNSSAHTGKIENYYYSYALYLNPGINLKLLGGTYQNSNEDDDAEAVIYYNIAEGYDPINVTIDGANTHIIADYCTGIAMPCEVAGNVVTVRNGATITAQDFCIANLGTYTDMNTTMNVESGAQLTSTEAAAIYHAGGGSLNISGENTVISGAESGIEIRAGELTMTGGKVISTWEGSESESWGNGNGTTTVGAGIAVAQHTTNQPIKVTISGGDIDAIIPVKLTNPQNNTEASINQVNVYINGGRYKVTNGASAPFWSVTENFAVSAGKFSHVPAYVVAGKTVIPNTDDDKNIYPWTIGDVNTTAVEPDNGKTNITWQTATDWENNVVPTSTDQVNIGANQNVVVSGESGVAQAYSITIPTGSTLTVESGATLVVGGGGITNEGGETNINGLKVEPGAQVIVSPDADMTGLYGRVALTPNVGKYPTEMVGEWYNKPNRYQLVGIPTKDAPDAITKNKDDGDGFKLNQWDVMSGWQAASLSDFSVPFKGFFFWNDVPVTGTASDLVTYYFKGELFGNKPQTLVFTENEGFHLFANSYLAEVDIMALIQGAENDVQKAVYVYDPVLEKFTDISYATYGKPGVPSAIAPMQGFYFLNQHNATTAPMDYVSMVWSNAFKVEQEYVPSAPRRNAAIDGSEVRINITDNVVGRTDGVYVMENDKYSAELDGSDVQKMMNPATSVNIYATTPVGNLSTMQTNDIENQYLTIETNAAPMYTMSFDWVAGDELYLLDTYNGRTTLMTEGNTYEFAAQPKSIINDRFQIVKTAAQAPTTIENMKNIKAVKGTYTVTGQCLGENVDWDKLPQGVYVIDGVKVVK